MNTGKKVLTPEHAQGFERVYIIEPEKGSLADTEVPFVATSVLHDLCDEQELVAEMGQAVMSDMVLEHMLNHDQCHALMSQKEQVERLLRTALTPLFTEVSASMKPVNSSRQVAKLVNEVTTELLYDYNPAPELVDQALGDDSFRDGVRNQLRPVLRQFLERP